MTEIIIVPEGVEATNDFANKYTDVVYKKAKKAMDYAGGMMLKSAENQLARGTPYRNPWEAAHHPADRTGELDLMHELSSNDSGDVLERHLTNTDDKARWLTKGTWAIGLEKAFGIQNPFGEGVPVPYPWLRPSFGMVKENIARHIAREIGADVSGAFKTVLYMD